VPADRRALIVRTAVIAAALVVCAWFVLGIRQAHDLARATSIVSGPGSIGPRQARRASALLRSAAVLNPDAQVDLLKGQLAFREGHRANAGRLFADVAKREPMNLTAWFWLAQAPENHQAWLFALARVAQLEPKVPDTG
jgi:hypothetical protein